MRKAVNVDIQLSDANEARASGGSVLREFVRQQLPIVAALLVAGFASAYFQDSFLPGGDRAFPLAGVRVPIWHLVWMGVWTGYTMALVGQAAGIFALPYSTSILQFGNPHVTPTMLVMTLFNPIGALLGFRRSGQWNLDLAAAVSAGGLVGGIIGPFLRATVLANADSFRITLGVALALFGLQLCHRTWRDYQRFGHVLGLHFFATEGQQDRERVPTQLSITTTRRSFATIRIRFGREERELSNISLFIAGVGVGVFSSALGVGGGFLLVPIFAAIWRLPIYIMVAATIPYTVALSLAGIVTFTFGLPLLGTAPIAPEWSWAFFSAAGGVFGSWWAAKTQIQVPQHFLGLMLGALTGMVGLLYLLSVIVPLPFRI